MSAFEAFCTAELVIIRSCYKHGNSKNKPRVAPATGLPTVILSKGHYCNIVTLTITTLFRREEGLALTFYKQLGGKGAPQNK